jgi:hypothetical protein
MLQCSNDVVRAKKILTMLFTIVVIFVAATWTTILLIHTSLHSSSVTDHPMTIDSGLAWMNNYNNNNSRFLQPSIQYPSKHVRQRHRYLSTRTVHIEIPIVIQLSGEFGNHLSKIAAGVGIAAMIHNYNNRSSGGITAERYLFTTNIHIRKQDHTTKGESALLIIQQCFPNLVQLQPNKNDGDASDDASSWSTRFPPALASKTKNRKHDDPYDGINSNRDSVVDTTLHHIIHDAVHAYVTANNTSGIENATTLSYFQTPFTLYSDHLVGFFDVYMDRYYDFYRQLFVIDSNHPDCGCTDSDVVPHPQPDWDEIVFYYRGYKTELPKKFKRLGFDEIHPNVLVSYLMETRRYQPSTDRIAIVSRFPLHTVQYVEALKKAGFNVRVIGLTDDMSTVTNSVASIMHDFCFLRHGQRELIGPIRSTFFMWASTLAEHTTRNGASGNKSSSLRVTAYTTETQMAWAHNLSIDTTSTTTAYDSITPMYHYQQSVTNRSQYDKFWQERHFFFPIFPSASMIP